MCEVHEFLGFLSIVRLALVLGTVLGLAQQLLAQGCFPVVSICIVVIEIAMAPEVSCYYRKSLEC